MTGKITFINRESDYGDKQCYSLTLANGQTFKFYQLAQLWNEEQQKNIERTSFHKKVGEEIDFEISNAKYNTAKLSLPKLQPTESKGFAKPKSQQSSIEWQSCLRSACLFYANTADVKSSTVLETTELFYNKLKLKTDV
tara:strand:+ start:96 stop:512 length:417 start_codon:yes stop_codon:yes gene_type:complete